MKKARFIIICFILFSSSISIVVADRPSYSFSDDVFSDLPPFPDDFFEIRKIFLDQGIMASQFGEGYLQPEMLETWDYWAERVYGKSGKAFGSYGIFCFPSEFNVDNVTGGDSFTISTLIYSNIGIRFYQGIKVGFEHPSSVIVNLTIPSNSNILLLPTYPYFQFGWMRILEFEIFVGDTGIHVVNLTEEKPDDYYNTLWGDVYDEKYITGMGMLSMKTPRLQVNIYPPEPDEEVVGGSNIFFDFFYVLFFFILGLLFFIWYKYGRKSEKEEVE